MSLAKSNLYKTPAELVQLLGTRFGPFTLDAAAQPWNAQAPEYFTPSINGLKQRWHGRVWCNPPYTRGNLERWVSYARHQVTSISRVESVTLLVPHYTAEGWWQRHVTPPQGYVRRAEWRWHQLPSPLRSWKRLISDGLVTDVLEHEGRIRFMHRSGRTSSPARHSSAIVVFSKPGALQ